MPRLITDIERVFGWSARDLSSDVELVPDVTPRLAASFKKPVNTTDEATTAYVVYAHYLALNASGLTDSKFVPPPSDWKEMRNRLMGRGGVSLRTVLEEAWDLGIAVLPLQDRIAIHGAFWNFSDRAAIVIKQGMRTSSRWTYDLLHEIYHAATESEGIVEDDGVDPQAELDANQYAADVLLDGRSEELIEQIVDEANGQIPMLKAATRLIAEKESVSTGALANALAWRLSLQNENWWGTASALQAGEDDPWEVCRDVLLSAPTFRVWQSRIGDS